MSFVDLVVRQQTHSLHQLKVARPESIYDNTLLTKNMTIHYLSGVAEVVPLLKMI